MLKISKRLFTMASFVPSGSTFADIGTDHGYLPVYLVSEGICPWAVAGDINAGPLEAARLNIAQYNLSGSIDLRLGNGLNVLRPDEVEVITIAGMGGGTIRDILTASPEVAARARRLILQPMADEAELRRFLTLNGWQIVDEELLLEDGRLYVIIVAERGLEAPIEPIVLEIGPKLLENHHPLLKELFGRLEIKYNKILSGLAKSNSAEAIEKGSIIRERFAQLEKLSLQLFNKGSN